VPFSIFDSLIPAVYLTVVLSIGFFYSRKKEKTTEDYFLTGRNSGWVAVGLSIFATKPERKKILESLFYSRIFLEKLNLNHPGSVSRDRSNIVIFAFILLLIISWWSI